MRLCLSKPIYLSYVQVHCLLDKAVVSAEEFATYSRFLIDFIKTSTLKIVFHLNKPFSNANHDISREFQHLKSVKLDRQGRNLRNIKAKIFKRLLVILDPRSHGTEATFCISSPQAPSPKKSKFLLKAIMATLSSIT